MAASTQGRFSARTPEFVPQSVRNNQRRSNTMKQALYTASIHDPNILAELKEKNIVKHILAPSGPNTELEAAYYQSDRAYAPILGKRVGDGIITHIIPVKQLKQEDVDELVYRICTRGLVPPPPVIRQLILKLSRHEQYEAIQSIIHCLPEEKSYMEQVINARYSPILSILVRNSLYYTTSDKSIPPTKPIVPRAVQLDCIQTIMTKSKAVKVSIDTTIFVNSITEDSPIDIAIRNMDTEVCGMLITSPSSVPTTTKSLWRCIDAAIGKNSPIVIQKLEQILELLIRNGFDINMMSNFLSHSIMSEGPTFQKTLLQHVEDIPSRWIGGRVNRHQLEAVKALLRNYGAVARTSTTPVSLRSYGGKRSRSMSKRLSKRLSKHRSRTRRVCRS